LRPSAEYSLLTTLIIERPPLKGGLFYYKTANFCQYSGHDGKLKLAHGLLTPVHRIKAIWFCCSLLKQEYLYAHRISKSHAAIDGQPNFKLERDLKVFSG
jgi:hypothetical protein